MDPLPPPSPACTPWYSDKALWVAIFAMVLPPLSRKLGVQMDPYALAQLTTVASGYIAGHHWKSWSLTKEEHRTHRAHLKAEGPANLPIEAQSAKS